MNFYRQNPGGCELKKEDWQRLMNFQKAALGKSADYEWKKVRPPFQVRKIAKRKDFKM